MLLIPAPTRGATALDLLVTDHREADRLLSRWIGATEHEHDGQRWIHLPLHVRHLNEAIA
jgi:hypothetical protein